MENFIGNHQIEKAFQNLLRTTDSELRTRLEEIIFSCPLETTHSSLYCHCVRVDGNGQLRLKDLAEFLACKVLDYAIPRAEINAAMEYYSKNKSTLKFSELHRKARSLFTSLEKTGEGGEILLYALVEEYLKIPQLICKMSLKTSPNHHYNGADGIHGKYDPETGNLELYWCESKMYADVNGAIRDCLESLTSYLLGERSNGASQERDLQLVTQSLEHNCSEFEDLLVQYFDRDKEASNHIIYKGIAFIGFDSTCYEPGRKQDEIKNEILKKLEDWKNAIKTRISRNQELVEKEIHIFLIPFPSVDRFRKYFLEEIGKRDS